MRPIYGTVPSYRAYSTAIMDWSAIDVSRRCKPIACLSVCRSSSSPMQASVQPGRLRAWRGRCTYVVSCLHHWRTHSLQDVAEQDTPNIRKGFLAATVRVRPQIVSEQAQARQLSSNFVRQACLPSKIKHVVRSCHSWSPRPLAHWQPWRHRCRQHDGVAVQPDADVRWVHSGPA